MTKALRKQTETTAFSLEGGACDDVRRMSHQRGCGGTAEHHRDTDDLRKPVGAESKLRRFVMRVLAAALMLRGFRNSRIL